VLIVDDDREIRGSLRNLLAASRFQVHLAASGGEALDLLDRQRFDAAVIDLMMPRLDGIGVMHALLARAEPGRPRVILVRVARVALYQSLADTGVRCLPARPFDAFAVADELTRALRADRVHPPG
jgi:two-component system response regulator MprA